MRTGYMKMIFLIKQSANAILKRTVQNKTGRSLMSKFSQFRNKGIQLINRNTQNNGSEIRRQLDELLRKDYEEIRNNKNANLMHCGVCSNNTLIMEYVRTIFQDYNIPDPLENGRQESQRKTIAFSAERRQSFSKETGATGLKIVSHQRAKSDLINQFSTPQKHQSTILNSTGEKGTTISLSERKQAEKSSPRNRYRDQGLVLTPKLSFGRQSRAFSVSESSQKPTLKKIKDFHRYCIACECPILQANIEVHQIECSEFLELYKMDVPEILKYLQNRIENVRSHLKKRSSNLLKSDVDNFQSNINHVLMNSEIVLQNGERNPEFYNNYNRAMQIGSKWSQTTEQINKLRWYIRIRENIKSHFGY